MVCTFSTYTERQIQQLLLSGLVLEYDLMSCFEMGKEMSCRVNFIFRG